MIRGSALFISIQALGWCGLAFAFAGLLVVMGRFETDEALRLSGAHWLPWIVYTPLVFWLAGKYPISRRESRWHIAIHVVAGLIITALSIAIVISISPPRMRIRVSDPRGPIFDMPRDVVMPAPPPPFPGDMTPAKPPMIFMAFRGNFGFSIYLIVLCAAHAVRYRQRAEAREKLALKLASDLHQSRLESLRLQLNPHFLFNTLNTVSAFVGRDPAKADELIHALSALLRASLEEHDDEVPLARELELLEMYLVIEKVRMGRRLRVEMQVEQGLDASLVPPLLLQPLAENAVRHGLEPRAAGGTVSISARRDVRTLVLIVADNGIGLSPEPPGRRGIGLQNTAERIRRIYGEAADFQIVSAPGGGVRVTLKLPFHTDSEQVKWNDDSPSPWGISPPGCSARRGIDRRTVDSELGATDSAHVYPGFAPYYLRYTPDP